MKTIDEGVYQYAQSFSSLPTWLLISIMVGGFVAAFLIMPSVGFALSALIDRVKSI